MSPAVLGMVTHVHGKPGADAWAAGEATSVLLVPNYRQFIQCQASHPPCRPEPPHANATALPSKIRVLDNRFRAQNRDDTRFLTTSTLAESAVCSVQRTAEQSLPLLNGSRVCEQLCTYPVQARCGSWRPEPPATPAEVAPQGTSSIAFGGCPPCAVSNLTAPCRLLTSNSSKRLQRPGAAACTAQLATTAPSNKAGQLQLAALSPLNCRLCTIKLDARTPPLRFRRINNFRVVYGLSHPQVWVKPTVLPPGAANLPLSALHTSQQRKLTQRRHLMLPLCSSKGSLMMLVSSQLLTYMHTAVMCGVLN
jgi:hypothetical protein